jgi:hypothetical protein
MAGSWLAMLFCVSDSFIRFSLEIERFTIWDIELPL